MSTMIEHNSVSLSTSLVQVKLTRLVEGPLYLLMTAARWLLVLDSMGVELSELRVARGFATVAVEFPLASPVQRSVNCNVGP